ncbi:MAG: fumarylacetoacetate hydrolase, partial [Comamonadaceae bacterium]
MSWLPTGTVYGVLLNSQAEQAALASQMHEAPYKAPPRAPILYVKTANTHSPDGASVPVPARVPQVEIGATVGLVMGAGTDAPSGLWV